ncbi:hypothetical protein [Paenibacillus gansuensis]|uniref:Uncharacterized protein n=1 Tax=Paenibacillus gansuensis TaxID=306542 RepID=A0ABW5PK18_9BACL
MGLKLRRTALIVLAAAASTALLCSCSPQQHRYEEKKKTETYNAHNSRSYGTLMADPKQHDNKRFEYSHRVSTAVSAMDGVAGSIVFLTERNAYVAVILDDSGLDIRGDGSIREQTNLGSMKGALENQMENSSGQKVVTGRNSYFTVNDHNDLGKEYKQKIAEVVRAQSPHVLEVHISANQEFINAMAAYAKVGWSGRDTKPLINNFNVMIKHFFSNGPIPSNDPLWINGDTTQMSIHRGHR